jgi:pimeloyl-ACP methyl ester carboxylesterase
MASDVLAVMNALKLEKAALIGWSDGPRTSMLLATKAPERVAGVFFFACNMDPSGTKDGFDFVPPLSNCFARPVKEYKQLSATPEAFDNFSEAVTLMQKTEPNYTVADLASIHVPVAIVRSENDEFIKREHAEYLAQSIPEAEVVFLEDVSHFAPLQRPVLFNRVMLEFLGKALK